MRQGWINLWLRYLGGRRKNHIRVWIRRAGEEIILGEGGRWLGWVGRSKEELSGCFVAGKHLELQPLSPEEVTNLKNTQDNFALKQAASISGTGRRRLLPSWRSLSDRLLWVTASSGPWSVCSWCPEKQKKLLWRDQTIPKLLRNDFLYRAWWRVVYQAWGVYNMSYHNVMEGTSPILSNKTSFTTSYPKYLDNTIFRIWYMMKSPVTRLL